MTEIERLHIIVDMINGFVKEGNMADPYIQHIIKNIEKIKADYTYVVRDAHNEDCEEFNRFPKHCIKGSKESELVSELQSIKAKDFEKNSTSAIYAPNFLNEINKLKKLRQIIITGCCTDICVLNLAIPLRNYFDNINKKNIEIIVPTDCVETYNSPLHNRDEYNGYAFKLMRQSGIILKEGKKL